MKEPDLASTAEHPSPLPLLEEEDNGVEGNLCYHAGLGIHSFQKNAMFLRSFTFFLKECSVLSVILRFL